MSFTVGTLAMGGEHVFDNYNGIYGHAGNVWENGESGKEQESGIFRLGFPYVPVSMHDIGENEYDFTPVPVEEGEPLMSLQALVSQRVFLRHPHARNAKLKGITINAVKVNELIGNVTITISKNLEPHALVSSPSGLYFGLKIQGESHIS